MVARGLPFGIATFGGPDARRIVGRTEKTLDVCHSSAVHRMLDRQIEMNGLIDGIFFYLGEDERTPSPAGAGIVAGVVVVGNVARRKMLVRILDNSEERG